MAAPPPRPSVPLAAALGASEPLAHLLARVKASRERFDGAVAPLLPESLRAAVRPGPLDDKGWVLLADSPAVAAKLRQLLPQLSAALVAAGWPEAALKVKVQPRG
jgi:hypothetical protein